MWIQSKLGITQSGVYDSITLEAVRDFQTTHGLESTGIVDEATVIALVS